MTLNEVAPPGFGHTKSGKGDKPHYKPGTDKKYKKYQEDTQYEKLKEKIGSKKKHDKPAIFYKDFVKKIK